MCHKGCEVVEIYSSNEGLKNSAEQSAIPLQSARHVDFSFRLRDFGNRSMWKTLDSKCGIEIRDAECLHGIGQLRDARCGFTIERLKRNAGSRTDDTIVFILQLP